MAAIESGASDTMTLGLQKMRRFDWKTKSLATAVLLLLVFVLNPELRAFLLILDFLGADLVVMLLGGYIHHYWSAISFYLRPALVCFATQAHAVGRALCWVAYGLHPRDGLWAQLDHIGIAGGVVGRSALARLSRRT